MVHHLEFEQWIRLPAARVFEFFSDPKNLPRLMPVSSQTRLEKLDLIPAPIPPSGNSAEKAAGVGSMITTSFLLFPPLPFRARWIARITEFEWNHHFADLQEKGPFKSWHHRHEFLGESRSGVGGTLIRDNVDYEIGMGIFETMANALFVRRQMQRTFLERQQRLPGLLG
jgi:ligand-binding SRPBCC domain-containing protein